MDLTRSSPITMQREDSDPVVGVFCPQASCTRIQFVCRPCKVYVDEARHCNDYRGSKRQFCFRSSKQLRRHMRVFHAIELGLLSFFRPGAQVEQTMNDDAVFSLEDAEDIQNQEELQIPRAKSMFEQSLVQNDMNYEDTVLMMVYRSCQSLKYCRMEEVKQRLDKDLAKSFMDIAKIALTSSKSNLLNLSGLVSKLLPLPEIPKQATLGDNTLHSSTGSTSHPVQQEALLAHTSAHSIRGKATGWACLCCHFGGPFLCCHPFHGSQLSKGPGTPCSTF